MGEIITYSNEEEVGIFCQIRLDSRERIFISIGREKDSQDSLVSVKISEMDSTGLIPIRTIWESCDSTDWIYFFELDDKEGPFKKPLLDYIVERLVNCRTIEEIEEKLKYK